MVFDRPGFDAASLADTPLGTLGRIEPLDLAHASGFRLVGRQLPPEVSADGNRWRLVFAPDARPPATPLVVGIATDTHGNRQLAIKVAGAHAALNLIDPDIGDTITVVPVTKGGAGILAAARLPDLSLLASTQGIAFLPLSDGLETLVDANAVVITGPQGGLTLSGTPPAVPGHGRGPAQAGLDVGTWALPGNVGDLRAQLAREVSTAEPANRQQARLRFARYLVSQGLGAEAIGLAKLIAQDDPALADDLGFRQMRGIAQAMQERPAEALTDLSLPALEFSPDAVLWRGYALAAQGQTAQAHRVFAGTAAVDHYPAHIATRLLAAMTDTALAADDLAAAAEFSRALGERAATAATKAQAQALAGRVALRNADVPAAREQFEAALASGERTARVDAELGLIELGLADGTMTRPQAIERLDRLRYAWRGDAKELAVLRRLADLQLAEGRWRDGLETLRVAMKLFPDDPGRDALAETQVAAFRRLFLLGAADALPPVQAVALYFDYRDLTPLGADGDEMIRRLADRLIQVELLDQAKTLLTHQVTYRLQGIAQAQVAANLALLHLADHEAAKALGVLDGTEQPTLPEATARLRRLLRAGALADLGRGAEAKALLAGDSSEDAARLGAEIAWNARDWAGAAQSLGRLLANVTPPAGGPPGAGTERLALRLAIAAALAKDAERLKALVQKWGPSMAQSKSAEAFAMLTGTTDPSAIATRNLAQTMANAGADTGFMDMLRQRLAAGQLNAIN
ncbi:hypothetical protein D3874_08825 [Oleomonas cavernae]|uniref:Tetratricopeptide repeat protein n=1 Tax=Oleomonas cavernae TaxID=2320859 RepID=A0A418WAY6_9PROT|nr:hypothetical protein [Oleomonas cavernae]RJF87116.1 hypothetical protein D3874_08825 [Oleomonas cavernae]